MGDKGGGRRIEQGRFTDLSDGLSPEKEKWGGNRIGQGEPQTLTHIQQSLTQHNGDLRTKTMTSA